jgi:hypothetical protein
MRRCQITDKLGDITSTHSVLYCVKDAFKPIELLSVNNYRNCNQCFCNIYIAVLCQKTFLTVRHILSRQHCGSCVLRVRQRIRYGDIDSLLILASELSNDEVKIYGTTS